MGTTPRQPLHVNPLWPVFLIFLAYVFVCSVMPLAGYAVSLRVRDLSINEIRPSDWHEKGRVRITGAVVLPGEFTSEDERFVCVVPRGGKGGNFLLMWVTEEDENDISKGLVGWLGGGSLDPAIEMATVRLDPHYSWRFAGFFGRHEEAATGKQLWNLATYILLTVTSAAAFIVTVIRVRQNSFRPIA